MIASFRTRPSFRKCRVRAVTLRALLFSIAVAVALPSNSFAVDTPTAPDASGKSSDKGTAKLDDKKDTPSPKNEIQSGTSSDFKYDVQKKDPYVYQATNPDFWGAIQSNVPIDNNIRILVLSQTYLDQSGGNADDQSEAKLAMGLGMERMGLTFGASRYYADLIRTRQGTSIALEALRGLNRIAQTHFYDTREIGDDLLASQEFGPLPTDLQSFVSFHAGLYNMKQGFREWADSEFKKVDTADFWGLRLEYLKALGEIARDKVDSGSARLTKMATKTPPFPILDQRVNLQLARLAFEHEKYDDAYARYRALNSFETRDQARVLTERAWTRFYQRDYSKALGELAVLDTPTYDGIQPFESYVLRMLIYKELCHYDLVRKTADQFRSRFHFTIARIKGRRLLKQDLWLARQSFLDYPRQQWADLINQLRAEMEIIQELHLTEIPSVAKIAGDYKNRESELKWLVDQTLEQDAYQAAEKLLDTEEQVSFLSYASTLDALRIIQKSEDRHYEREKISFLKFDSIYWPEDGELWTDEFPDFKVLIRSQCDLYESASPNNLKLSLPKEFQ